MLNLLNNSSIKSFLDSFPQEDWLECIENLCLIGIKQVRSELFSLDHLKSLARPPKQKKQKENLKKVLCPVSLSTKKPKYKKTSQDSITISSSSRTIPKYLKNVPSKISDLTHKDRSNFFNPLPREVKLKESACQTLRISKNRKFSVSMTESAPPMSSYIYEEDSYK